MKVLVISRSVWNTNNSFGNTYDNLFKRFENIEIAHVFLCDGMPDFNLKYLKSFFQIPESDITDSFLKSKKKPIGREVTKDTVKCGSKSYDAKFQAARNNRSNILYILRDYIWKKANINYYSLFSFVEEFKPDIIFMPLYYANYVSRVAIEILKKFNIKLVMQVSIDVYSLRHFSFSPFFWIRRFSIRKTIRKIISHCSLLYTISEKQRLDYEKYLKIPCSVLYKFYDSERKQSNSVVEKGFFLYAGNIGDGRWKVLAEIGDVLAKNNVGKLHVYSMTTYSKRMKRIMGNCVLHGPVSSSEVIELQNKADFLVHVESFSLENRNNVRYSISTKIMDYLSLGGKILAVGPKDVASMELISNNELGFCFNSISDLKMNITLLSDQSLASKYCNNCFKYIGNQKERDESSMFLRDLELVIGGTDE